jgi:FlaG/FlaF family flagellin (archaellin)
MKKNQENAVSPVVGVMLMLVVVIIIAAIVSAFAGGTVSGVKKAPQASITGKFSLSNGFEITHAGGDAIALQNTRFVVRDGPTFGSNLEQKTADILNQSVMQNMRTGNFVIGSTGSYNETAFVSGDTLWITGANSTCSVLQPVVNSYSNSNLCLNSASSIGKTFWLEVSDVGGNLISRAEVTITP